MTQCPNCGISIEDGAVVCNNCGTQFGRGYDDRDRQQRQEQAPQPRQGQNQQPQREQTGQPQRTQGESQSYNRRDSRNVGERGRQTADRRWSADGLSRRRFYQGVAGLAVLGGGYVGYQRFLAGGSNNPASVVRAYFTALNGGDAEKVDKLTFDRSDGYIRVGDYDQLRVTVRSVENQSVEEVMSTLSGMDTTDPPESAREMNFLGDLYADEAIGYEGDEWTWVYFNVGLRSPSIDDTSFKDFSLIIKTDDGWQIGYLAPLSREGVL